MRQLLCGVLGVSLFLLWSGLPQAEEQPRLANERVVMHTTMGDLVLALWPDVAPGHVEQFLTLVRLGVYDTMRVYYVRPAYLVQFSSADFRATPLTTEQQRAIHPLKAEFSQVPHRRGVLSMAREDDNPDSGETSFSILLDDASHLDGKYTVFGHVEFGDDVLEAIGGVHTNRRFEPTTPIIIQSAEIVPGDRLAQLPLRIPMTSLNASSPIAAFGPIVVFVCLTMLGLVVFLLAGRQVPRWAGSLGLLLVLIGSFCLFTLLVPQSSDSELLATALFLGSVAMFRLMATFENPRRVRDAT